MNTNSYFDYYKKHPLKKQAIQLLSKFAEHEAVAIMAKSKNPFYSRDRETVLKEIIDSNFNYQVALMVANDLSLVLKIKEFKKEDLNRCLYINSMSNQLLQKLLRGESNTYNVDNVYNLLKQYEVNPEEFKEKVMAMEQNFWLGFEITGSKFDPVSIYNLKSTPCIIGDYEIEVVKSLKDHWAGAKTFNNCMSVRFKESYLGDILYFFIKKDNEKVGLIKFYKNNTYWGAFYNIKSEKRRPANISKKTMYNFFEALKNHHQCDFFKNERKYITHYPGSYYGKIAVDSFEDLYKVSTKK